MAHKASPPLLESTRVRPRGQCRAFACTPEQQMDTSTPAGKMVFTVLGAVAELERSLIVKRVKAGLRNARAKGKRLRRPRTILDTKRIATLRAQGVGWKRIAAGLGVGVGTIYRVALEGSKTREKVS